MTRSRYRRPPRASRGEPPLSVLFAGATFSRHSRLHFVAEMHFFKQFYRQNL